MSIISASNISKSFTKVQYGWPNFWSLHKEVKTAVDDLSVQIDEGELVGFLGPNGAGKTTFLKILSGIVHPTSGQANILGFTPWQRNHDFLRQIAIVMGQKNQLWWDLPAIDSFNMLKEVYEIPVKKYRKNLDQMVEVLNMKELLTKRLRNMSLGERMKCELAASFLHDPKIIFLDEPTIGLDVISAKSIRIFLKEINKTKKCTLILTSHYMGDIEELCKRVIIINHGQKVYDGDLAELKNEYAPEKEIVILLNGLEDKKKFAHLKGKNKKIIENKGIIRVGKEDIALIVGEVFDKFEIENVVIQDIETEEVITRVFEKKKTSIVRG